MPTHDGLTEPDIIINGRPLTFPECMSVRVAVGSMRIALSEPTYREGIGEPLAGNYDRHLATVEQAMLRGRAEPEDEAPSFDIGALLLAALVLAICAVLYLVWVMA